MASAGRYRLNYTDEAKSQLRALPGLTRHERNSLFLRIHHKLKRLPDRVRDDPEYRVEPGSTELIYPLVFPGGDGEPIGVVFIIDVRPAPYGVLDVISVQRMNP